MRRIHTHSKEHARYLLVLSKTCPSLSKPELQLAEDYLAALKLIRRLKRDHP
jgi:hypothetical protein